MAREISAGGVVLRQISGVWHVALIEPEKSAPPQETPAPVKMRRKRSGAVFGLPKGLVDPGEKPQAAAVREVFQAHISAVSVTPGAEKLAKSDFAALFETSARAAGVIPEPENVAVPSGLEDVGQGKA